MTAVQSFLPHELAIAAGLAIVIEATLFIVLATTSSDTSILAREDAPPESTPIEVKPVLDELPLLKLGSKKVKAKLPDMWVKKPPIKRYEAASAPSPSAEATPDKIPDTPLPKPSAEAPPPDASIAKKVDEIIPPDAGPRPPANLPTEGAEDGVKEGTETDPMKAFATSQYRVKIASWFRSRWKAPTGIPCAELKKMNAFAAVNVGPDRAVTGFSLSRPSGNVPFDASVKSALDAIVASGAELPPPPPNYPDILSSVVTPSFATPPCD